MLIYMIFVAKKCIFMTLDFNLMSFVLNRDVSGVDLLINNHQSLKAEIDAREENFAICINLGKALLERNHYRSDEVSLCIKSLSF